MNGLWNMIRTALVERWTQRPSLLGNLGPLKGSVAHAPAPNCSVAREQVLFRRAARREGAGMRKILVVGRGEGFAPPLMDYALRLAERTESQVVLLSVGDDPAEGPGLSAGLVESLRDEFDARSARAVEPALRVAAASGVPCRHAVRYGDVVSTVTQIQHEAGRLELVLALAGEAAGLAERLAVPVFAVSAERRAVLAMTEKGASPSRGATFPARKTEDEMSKPDGRRKLVGKTLAYGLLSGALYVAVFQHASALTSLFARGGFHAALPVATALVFSFVHGAFAHNLWACLGIEPARKDSRVEKRVAPARKDRRPGLRPRLSA